MRVNRRLLFWGLGFLSAGLVALAIQQGYLDRSMMAGTWRLWPLILVALGISFIASRTPFALAGTALAAVVIGASAGTAVAVGPAVGSNCGGPGTASLQDHTGTFGRTAKLDWQLNCGTLDVTVGRGATWRASLGTTGKTGPRIDAGADHLDLNSADQGGFLMDRGRERWVVQLPAATTYDANIRTNASTVMMDLSESQFSALALQPNAADVRMRVDGASIEGFDLQMNAGALVMIASRTTTLSGVVEMNAGSMNLCLPADAGVRITASGTAFGTNLGSIDFNRSGDTYESSSYAAAQHRITLTVRGNAASFDLNPPGGCQ
jgi:hypothetical protein